MTYADKQCKGGRLSEGGADYVHHSINAMAKAVVQGMIGDLIIACAVFYFARH